MSTGANGTHSLFTKMLVRCFSTLPDNLRPLMVFVGSAPLSNTEHRTNLRECILQGG
jgi:hypothetical protein